MGGLSYHWALGIVHWLNRLQMAVFPSESVLGGKLALLKPYHESLFSEVVHLRLIHLQIALYELRLVEITPAI